MTQSQTEQSLAQLNHLLLEGKTMEAFETFYHDDVEMQENNLPPTVSKAANRLRELEFLGNVTEFRSAQITGSGVNGNLSYVVWEYDYTHREWGIRNYSQVSIQEWREGKVVREIFVYNK